MSGFRDDLGAALKRQEDLEQENSDLKAELERTREAARDRTPTLKAAAPPRLPSWVFGLLGATVLASGAAAYLGMRASDGGRPAPAPHEGAPDPLGSVSFVQPTPPTQPNAQASADWTSVPLPSKAALHAIDGGVDLLYAVGDGGTILRKHKAEDVWRLEDSRTTATLRAVTMQLGRVIAAGDGGVIVALASQEETSFHAIPNASKKTRRAIRVSSFGVLAVGDDGTILHAPSFGLELTAEKSPTTKTLRGICSSLTDTWIVGDGGTLLHATLTGIEVVDSSTTENLNAVVCDATKVIAVGDRGTVIQRSDPRAKFTVTHEGGEAYAAVASYYGVTTWLAGGKDALLSESWENKRRGLHGDIDGLAFTTMGTYAVGSDGLFLAH
ncbi:hypothetical protein BH09MYX1_BH09MYX1_32980 [soil metagenome]